MSDAFVLLHITKCRHAVRLVEVAMTPRAEVTRKDAAMAFRRALATA
jgi:hypothetical protein